MVAKSRTKEYDVWLKMIARCHDPRSHRYNVYGARGLTVCDRWRESFDNFIEDMGWRPADKKSIDRIDNDQGYSKENCRWATDIEQARNRRNNVHYEYDGKLRTLAEIVETTGHNYYVIYARLRQGKTLEEALK